MRYELAHPWLTYYGWGIVNAFLPNGTMVLVNTDFGLAAGAAMTGNRILPLHVHA